MLYKNIAGTDLYPSAICMGGGVLSIENGMEYSTEMLDIYIDLGGNFIDTANIYGKWLSIGKNVSELYIGEWMKKRNNRHAVIIGTKGGHPNLDTGHISRLSKEEVTADLEESLLALQTDYIDFYWLHRDNESLPVEFILEYLNEFVKEGKIRYFGCSNWKAHRIQEAMELAKSKRIQGFAGNQMLWSIAVPNMDAFMDKTLVSMDKDGIELHKKYGLTAIPYSSQANGFFEKLEHQGIEKMNESVKAYYYNTENLKKFEKIKQLSKELSRSVTEIILGYLLSQPFPTIPIVGSRTIEQLEDSMKAGDFILHDGMDKTKVELEFDLPDSIAT
jgi:aryl-alcohol dehydrogenase-like predicted oxidoreductase